MKETSNQGRRDSPSSLPWEEERRRECSLWGGGSRVLAYHSPCSFTALRSLGSGIDCTVTPPQGPDEWELGQNICPSLCLCMPLTQSISVMTTDNVYVPSTNRHINHFQCREWGRKRERVSDDLTSFFETERVHSQYCHGHVDPNWEYDMPRLEERTHRGLCSWYALYWQTDESEHFPVVRETLWMAACLFNMRSGKTCTFPQTAWETCTDSHTKLEWQFVNSHTWYMIVLGSAAQCPVV